MLDKIIQGRLVKTGIIADHDKVRNNDRYLTIFIVFVSDCFNVWM